MKRRPLSKGKDRIVRYKDHSIRIVLSILAAHIMTFYNDPESFFEAVVTKSYIRGFIASFVMSYIIITYIHYITVRLDKLYDWHGNTLNRFFWQLCLGLLVPAFLAFLLVFAFLDFYGINIFETEYLQQDYPIALLMLLVINVYYFGLYSFIKAKNESIDQIDANKDGKVSIRHNCTETPIEKETVQFKEVIMVTTLTQTIPVNANDIAYAFRLSGSVFIRLKTMGDLNESYQVPYTLKDLEALLDPLQFFRINRQMLVNYSCITGYQPEKSKTLSLTLDPPPYPVAAKIPQEHRKLHIVSEDRSSRFKLWMDR